MSGDSWIPTLSMGKKSKGWSTVCCGTKTKSGKVNLHQIRGADSVRCKPGFGSLAAAPTCRGDHIDDLDRGIASDTVKIEVNGDFFDCVFHPAAT